MENATMDDAKYGDTDTPQAPKPAAQAGKTSHTVTALVTGSSGIASGLQPGGILPSTGGFGGGLGSLDAPDAAAATGASGGAAPGGKAEGGSA
jgi:hypothetical protein